MLDINLKFSSLGLVPTEKNMVKILMAVQYDSGRKANLDRSNCLTRLTISNKLNTLSFNRIFSKDFTR